MDEWEVDRLDLEAYLSRVGYRGSRQPGAEALTDLNRAHLAAIGFENLDIMMGRPIRLDLDSLQAKLVARPRGGYCYEHNLLFAAALEQLGYRVLRLAARVRVGRSQPAPRTHMLLLVEAEGRRWLTDVGFGTGLLQPLDLDGGPARQGDWTFRVDEDREAWVLQSLTPAGWTDLYLFTCDAQHPEDYRAMNHFTSTSAGSPFTRGAVVLRSNDRMRRSLRGLTLTEVGADGTTACRAIAPGDYLEELRGFGIVLEPDEAEVVLAAMERAAAGPGR